MPTRTVAVAELKARLSEYLAAAKAGQEVLITDRGRPVARLVPLTPATASEGRMAALSRAGLVREPSVVLTTAFLARDRVADPTGRSLEAVLEERAEDR